MTARLAENDSEIFIDGPSYGWVLDRIHTDLAPRSYLEIGTQFGHTLRLSRTRTVAVDPAFHLGDLRIDPARVILREMTSDDYFARHRPHDDLGGAVDFAFLDGMHEFPFLLRDFINTEKAVAPGAIVAMHDCVPRDAHMTRLARDLSAARATNYPNFWTGDVWKMIPVLRRYRPDLEVRCLDAVPTGLTIVRNLDPASTVLSDAYDQILRDWERLTLDAYGLGALFAVARIESAQAWADSFAPPHKALVRGVGRLVQPRRRLQWIIAAVGLGAR
jgi:hypothetical protein